MIAAIISVFLILFLILLLQVYVRWFLASQTPDRNRNSVSLPPLLGSRFHHFHNFTVDRTIFVSSVAYGLESSVISLIPLFVFKANDHQKHGLECVICLTGFEDEEMGRKLPRCGHAFHVECIDMWLNSHSDCPMCRAQVVCDNKIVDANSTVHDLRTNERDCGESLAMSFSEIDMGNEDSELEIIVEVPYSQNDSISVCSSSSSLSSQMSSL